VWRRGWHFAAREVEMGEWDEGMEEGGSAEVI
jgi:hypothetical protein